MKVNEVVRLLKDYEVAVVSDSDQKHSTLFNFFDIIAYRATPNGPDIRFIKVNEKFNELFGVAYNEMFHIAKNFDIEFPTVEYIVTINNKIRHYILIHSKWKKLLDRYVTRDFPHGFIEKRIFLGEKGILIYTDESALFLANDELYENYEQKFNFEYPKRIKYQPIIINEDDIIEQIKIFELRKKKIKKKKLSVLIEKIWPNLLNFFKLTFINAIFYAIFF